MSLNLVLAYESSALAAPQSFRDGMQTAANILDSLILNNITVTIRVGYGDWNNGGDTGLTTGAEGGDLNGLNVSYANLRAALASHETSTVDQTFVNSLPNTSSVNGVSNFYVPSAVDKALGFLSPTNAAVDGAVGMGTQISSNLLVGVALHELTHAMGRAPGEGPFDLFRYTSPGVDLFSSANTAPAAYFSIDGGNTKIADFGRTLDPSDFLNSGVQGSNDPFNQVYSNNTIQNLTTVDKEILDVLGFNIGSSTNHAPVANADSYSVNENATLTVTAAGVLANDTDADGNSLTAVLASNPSHGTLTLNASGSFTYTPVANYVGTDSFTYKANDGTVDSASAATVSITVNAVIHAPVVTASDYNAARGQSIAAYSLFSVTDADGKPITQYQFYDTTAGATSGHLVIDGVAQPDWGEFLLTPQQLAQSTTFQAGSSTSDTIDVRAFDGTNWSAWTEFHVNVVPNHPPVVSALDYNAARGQSIAAYSLFSVTDADANPMTQYQLYDTTLGATSGHFVVDGVAKPDWGMVQVTAQQLAQSTTFQAGSSTSDTIDVRAFDGTDWSAWTEFHVKVIGGTSNIVNSNDVAWNGAAAASPSAAPVSSDPTNSGAILNTSANDTFVFGPTSGNEIVNNFHSGIDTIEIDHTLAADFAAIQAHAFQVGSDVAISFDTHDTLTLKNAQVGSLHASDFWFV
jgi:VCBS repeat-containing protein